jgi:hypothetical protein
MKGRSIAATMNRLSLLAVLLLLACAPRSASEATVSGKTTYRDMGWEGVAVEVQCLEAGQWAHRASIRSGYHGSFVARLRPGQYRLSASAELPTAHGGTVWLFGTLERLEVSPGAGRIDRLVIRLAPAGPLGGSGS